MHTQQLPLSLRWPSHQRLDTFMAGANAHAIEAVRALAERGGESWLYLHGPRGSGKTHLLIGACRLALASGRNVRYLPLAALEDSRAEAIASFAAERGEVLSVDDVQVIAGDAHAERALFDLYNRAREARAILLFAASAPPNQIDLQLPDLVSRLSACTQHALQSLDEAGRREVLRMRAQQRGLQIDDAVLDWLFARRPRDLAALMELFERLDQAALAAQRRITIPFLRGMLPSSNAR